MRDKGLLFDILSQIPMQGELNDICYKVSIGINMLSGSSLQEKGQSLYFLMELAGRVDDLEAVLRKKYPQRFLFSPPENTIAEEGANFVVQSLDRSLQDVPLIAGGLVPTFPIQDEGQRWAVLVGVNTYKDILSYGELRYAVKDAKSVQQVLLAGGYEVERVCLLTDKDDEPLRENIFSSLQAAADATEAEDTLLFYFSGHGDVENSEAYLIPGNGRGNSIEYTAIALKSVKHILEKAKARKKVIILDSCHSGATLGTRGGRRMSEDFYKNVFADAEGLAILSACKQGEFSYEPDALQGGVFTYYLVEALQGFADKDQAGFVAISDVNRYVCDKVRAWTQQYKVKQTPTLRSYIAGDIILTRYKHFSH